MGQTATSTGRRRLGLSWWAIVLLAALAVPRVVTHDLDLVGPLANALLVFVPLVCWVLVAFLAKVPNPVSTLFVVGLVYGVLLAVGHQLLWGYAYDGAPPSLGGNLDTLSVTAQAVLMRVFAALSSVVTGAVVGAVTGVVAWLSMRATGRNEAV